MSKKIFAANWKMYLNDNESKEFMSRITSNKEFFSEFNIMIFPNHLSIAAVQNLAKDLPNIKIGMQDCDASTSGAITGSNSITSLDVDSCIVGHSERRNVFNESNEIIKSKLNNCLNNIDSVILCVGESLTNREEGKALEYIEKQIYDCLPNNFKNSFIAYEPIWSIGTGKIPSAFEIQEMHSHIKKIVFRISNKNINVLYGGSVNTENINEILKITNVDGVLVGGASLKAKDFLAIYSAAVKHLDTSS